MPIRPIGGVIVLACVAAASTVARAQLPPPGVQVALGFGVDTSRSPNREIFALYQSYLAQRLDTIRPSPYWSRAEQQRWPIFDLLGGYIYQGFSNFTVVHLTPAVGLDSTYLIRTLIASVDDSTHAVRPLALYRVYAVREEGRWVLANALPRLTRAWSHETIGRVTFFWPPAHPFTRARAAASAAFVDSLARAFQLPPPPVVDYFFTDDLIETLAAMGLDFFPLGSDTLGGRSNVPDRLVFVGSSGRGEGYRHELAHVVLQPLISRSNTTGLVTEGLMTWTGGSAGLDFQDLVPGLAGYIAAHPDLSLRNIMETPLPRVGTLDVGYDGFAVLCDMIYRAGGLAALRDWLRSGTDPDSVLGRAARLLHVAPDRLDATWRRRLAIAGGRSVDRGPAASTWADSTSRRPEAEVYRTWRRYLESKAPHYQLGAWQPSPYWLAAEQQQWHVYALAMAYLPDSARPEVLSIEPTSDRAYRVVTRFYEDSATSPLRAPTVRMTVFAVRSGGGWVFANALPRLTRAWRRETVGPFTYIMEPGYPFDRGRADRAVAFTDSVAAAFGVPRLQALTYYLTSTVDEVYHIMGLETDIKWGPVGGVAQPTNHQLFSGIPAVGEDYRHELAHMVLLPLMGNTSYLVSEGVPTWLGGTTGMDFRTAARGLATFLADHPAVTLDSILSGRFRPQYYPAGAVFAQMVFERGGVDAVKALYDAGALEDFRAKMERLFGRSWPTIVADWRERALSYGSP